MPITAKTLKRLRKAVSFDYLGETVHIEYYPAALSSDSVAQLRKIEADVNAARDANDEAAAMDALTSMGAWICELIASWDYLEDDESTPVALTPARVAQAITSFSDFIGEVIKAAIQDKQSGNANGTTPSVRSDATS